MRRKSIMLGAGFKRWVVTANSNSICRVPGSSSILLVVMIIVMEKARCRSSLSNRHGRQH